MLSARRTKVIVFQPTTNGCANSKTHSSTAKTTTRRSAFKAISDNKHVALLTPTTLLTFQHYETFKQRFAAFPITIEMISRFRSAKQQSEILKKVETGKVDILIGTHRLLSKDVKFPDPGLLIVDEEHRFGVPHKERLKQMRKEVDVLTMSATPIPRTLH